MDGAEVFVVTTAKGTDNRCGVLKVRDIYTIEGQTYKIPCDLKCGDEVKVTLQHRQGTDQKMACLNIREITAYQSAGRYIYIYIGIHIICMFI